ncbi:MAG: response regulator transcription factor [Flavobacteriales bacterium]|nr:response regulator transcription factor [Flavobacteriales bacterium]
MSRKLSALIVDDEEFARENLKMLLEEYCPEVRVDGLAGSAGEARKLLEELSPDVVFLDIMMPGEDGFSFLKSLEGRKFAVVFTTAFREHALRAIKESAVDYLEKPVDIDELRSAVGKLIERAGTQQQGRIAGDRLSHILETIALTNTVEKTVIPTKDGYAVVRNTDIIHLEADENYTTIYVVGGKKYVTSKNIKAFEDKLDPHMFFRVHKSHIINIAHHLKEFIRTEGNIAVMSNQAQVPVSRRKLQEFLDKLESL